MVLERIAEQRIADATGQGAFDGLSGRGQRLNLDNDAAVPSEWRAAFRLPKSAGFAPEWVALGREIDEARDWLQPALAEGREAGVDRKAEIAALKRRIDEYNLQVPRTCLQNLRFRV